MAFTRVNQAPPHEFTPPTSRTTEMERPQARTARTMPRSAARRARRVRPAARWSAAGVRNRRHVRREPHHRDGACEAEMFGLIERLRDLGAALLSASSWMCSRRQATFTRGSPDVYARPPPTSYPGTRFFRAITSHPSWMPGTMIAPSTGLCRDRALGRSLGRSLRPPFKKRPAQEPPSLNPSNRPAPSRAGRSPARLSPLPPDPGPPRFEFAAACSLWSGGDAAAASVSAARTRAGPRGDALSPG